jgi:hypothetical protein
MDAKKTCTARRTTHPGVGNSLGGRPVRDRMPAKLSRPQNKVLAEKYGRKTERRHALLGWGVNALECAVVGCDDRLSRSTPIRGLFDAL